MPAPPWSLAGAVAAAHAAHTITTAAVSWLAASPAPLAASAVILGGTSAQLAVGSRYLSVAAEDWTGALTPTAEERQVYAKIRDWPRLRGARKLGDTHAGQPELTVSGIVCSVRLDGGWTVPAFIAAADRVRALLGLRRETRLEIRPGERGDWAQLIVRTRSAADGLSMIGWRPGDAWAVSTVTGATVPVPLGRRLLVAGTTGSGKSWSLRPLLAEASERPDHRLVVLDMKRQEAKLWSHRALVAVEPDEILAVTEHLVAEMIRREKSIPRDRDTVAIGPEVPRITVFVDELGELIEAASAKAYKGILTNLRSLSRRARAAEIPVVAATQKPTMSGAGAGMDSQMSAQITTRLALMVSTAAEARVILGDDAVAAGWRPDLLPGEGYAYLRQPGRADPEVLRMRAIPPAEVIKLPDRPVWSPPGAESAGPPALTLVKGGGQAARSDARTADTAHRISKAAPEPERSRLETLREYRATHPGASLTETAKATGIPRGSLSRLLTQLEAESA